MWTGEIEIVITMEVLDIWQETAKIGESGIELRRKKDWNIGIMAREE